MRWYNQEPKTKFIKVDNKNYTPDMRQTSDCIRCGNIVLKDEQSWVSQCSQCKMLINFFKPTLIQLAAILSESNILFNIGAVGSGKTTISAFMVSTFARDIAGARIICISNTLEQLERNAISELKKFFHKEEFSKQLKDTWVLKNGSVIELWPSDDPDKLRSANANLIWLIEANSYKMKLIYNEALSRLRNQKGFVYEYDENGEIVLEKTKSNQVKPKILQNKNLLLIEGNPKRGSWFNTEILKSHTIIHTTNVKAIDTLKVRAKPLQVLNKFTNEVENVNMIGILNATYDNPFLDNAYFINMKAACSTEEEYDNKVYCDITAQEGLVFKEAINNLNKFYVDIQEGINQLDQDEVFVESFDLGGSRQVNDPDAYILMIFNKRTKQLKLLDCFKISGLSLDESCRKIWMIRNKWGWKRDKYFVFTADNALSRASKSSSQTSLKTDYEIRLSTPIIPCNNKGIQYGVNLIKSWFNREAIIISKQCDELIKEMLAYETFQTFQVIKGTDAVQSKSGFTETNNHLLDAFRYAIVILDNMGYRQDQHLIDYFRQQNQQQTNQFLPKEDIRNYLPNLFGGTAPLNNKAKKIIKL